MGEIFRIANCNAANFNFPGVRYAGRPGPDGAPIAQEVFDSKIGWLSKLLEDQKVDLLGLEELFHKDALKALIAKTTIGADHVFAPDLDTNIGPTGEASGPFCGIVSRYPLTNTVAIRDFPPAIAAGMKLLQSEADPTSVVEIGLKRFQRPVLRADVTIKIGEDVKVVTVFVAHLKSKREQFLAGEDPKDQVVQALGTARSLMVRAAESAALRALVVEATKGNSNPVIVLGDLNDDLTSVTTQAIAGDEPPSFMKLDDKKVIFDTLMYSAHDIQEQNSHRSVSYSHIYNGRYELLDHIFLSQEFVAQNPDRIAEVRNTRVFNDHLYDSRLEGDRSLRTMNTSDHGIPICEIEWRKKPGPL